MAGIWSFGTGPWDPTHRFHTSWLLGPWLLFACRAVFSLWAFTTLFFIIGWTCANPAPSGGCLEAKRMFSYFTVLAYWGQAFYFLVAAVHTLVYALSSRPLLARLPRPLQALHSLFYSSVVTLPLIVTVVYWAVLYRGPWYVSVFEAWRNISEHALNSGLALFEIIVPRTDPLPWAHLPWLCLCLLGYLAVAYITVAHQGFYTYTFLDHDKAGGRGFVAAYIIGIAIGLVIVFSAIHGLILLRCWLTESKLGMQGKFVGPPPTSTINAEMNATEAAVAHSKEAQALASPSQL